MKILPILQIKLLDSGEELIDLPESDWCCGSAGTYNLSHPRESQILLERKMNIISNSGVDVIATANTGCYIQLLSGTHEQKLMIEVMHIVELLAKAYKLGE